MAGIANGKHDKGQGGRSLPAPWFCQRKLNAYAAAHIALATTRYHRGNGFTRSLQHGPRAGEMRARAHLRRRLRPLAPAVLRIPCFCGHAPNAGAHLRLCSRCSPKSRSLGGNRDCNAVGRASAPAYPWPHPAYVYYDGMVIEFPNRQTQSASPQDTPTPYERADNRGDLAASLRSRAKACAILGRVGKPHAGERRHPHGTRHHGLNVIHPR